MQTSDEACWWIHLLHLFVEVCCWNLLDEHVTGDWGIWMREHIVSFWMVKRSQTLGWEKVQGIFYGSALQKKTSTGAEKTKKDIYIEPTGETCFILIDTRFPGF